MNKDKTKRVMFWGSLVLLGFIVLSVIVYGLIWYHEQGHVAINAKYGLESKVTIDFVRWVFLTQPIDVDCQKIDCNALLAEQAAYDANWYGGAK